MRQPLKALAKDISSMLRSLVKTSQISSLEQQSQPQTEDVLPPSLTPAEEEPFEWIPEGWKYLETHPTVRGWESPAILDIYMSKWSDYVSRLERTAPISFTPESPVNEKGNLINQNTIMIFAYSLTLAARGRQKISVLDWGGSIGHYYLLAKAFLPGVEVEYHCKDVPMIAEYGQKLLPQARFYADDACLSKPYDFVLASGSLQYSQDWSAVFSQLAAATSGYLLVTRLPTVKAVPSYVFIQRPYAHGYNTEYLAWCLNREEFMHIVQATGLQLMREFVVGDNHPIPNAPEGCEYYGFLFRKPTEI